MDTASPPSTGVDDVDDDADEDAERNVAGELAELLGVDDPQEHPVAAEVAEGEGGDAEGRY